MRSGFADLAHAGVAGLDLATVRGGIAQAGHGLARGRVDEDRVRLAGSERVLLSPLAQADDEVEQVLAVLGQHVLLVGAAAWGMLNAQELLQTALLSRPGNQDAMIDLLYDYRTNPGLYPQWQEYFRTHQPPALITWGANDEIFPEAGAHPYQRDLPEAEVVILKTGHFALEDHADVIAGYVSRFTAGLPEYTD
jgi:pimeloyl-ACP methyl ester carboxylesterase